MNSSELARKIIDCLSDGYDDEENREEVETEQECKYAYIENDKIVME